MNVDVMCAQAWEVSIAIVITCHIIHRVSNQKSGSMQYQYPPRYFQLGKVEIMLQITEALEKVCETQY